MKVYKVLINIEQEVELPKGRSRSGGYQAGVLLFSSASDALIVSLQEAEIKLSLC